MSPLATGFRLRPLLAMVFVVTLGCGSTIAQEQGEQERANKFDSEHMFGFTEGSGIGAVGEKELETDSIGRFRRAAGS